ncbi:hypothetical protein [Paenibacillus sp. GCM10023250]|uniref:hypothetical protein n=1 Tax=Paenibacillus sp. GCM10023250 TaxID=3252648 RepID=UPI003612CF2D
MNGSYSKPVTFMVLEQLDAELESRHERSLDHYLGLILDFGAEGYGNATPEDAVSFAWTGMDGEHFAFDTQSGKIGDLENAPILFVRPMEFEEPVKRAAGSLKDFLSFLLRIKDYYLLERFEFFESEAAFLEEIAVGPKRDESEFAHVRERLIALLDIREMANPYTYLKALQD